MTFKAASLNDFHRHHRQFRPLFESAGISQALWDKLNTDLSFLKMVVVTEALDLPAAAGIAKQCGPLLVGCPPHMRKQFATAIGGMVRTIMVANGYETSGTKRGVPPVQINGTRTRVFKTAEVYRRSKG